MDTCKPNILVVDDHALFRFGLVAMIKSNYKNAVIHETENGLSTYNFIENNPLPDLIFLDIMLPDTNGVEIAKTLKADYPDLKIIILSSEVNAKFVEELLEIDVEGYINKTAPTKTVIDAMEAVCNGEKFYGKSVSEIIYQIYLAKSGNKKSENILDTLTARELEIIELMSDGLSSKAIGEKLCISHRTVEGHKDKLMKKLNLNSIAEVVKFAIKNKIIEL
ncbi:MAG: response regulator transcription factor [Lentimicrobiaceae bacterium]|nr:response regulator transcription factor [Lentimicrobiaceae bacterium]